MNSLEGELHWSPLKYKHYYLKMTQRQQNQQTANETGFKVIQLLKNETLGVGSYGSVYKARCDDIVCAAKIIHPTLVPFDIPTPFSQQREHRQPIKRFELECHFLRDIKHPNIIQYLGMYHDPETGLPVLLMELMDESLTHFLETSAEPIPYHIQLTICLDIIQALSFLHSNGIVHRDLSSNNILLIGKGRAKLTDFGMAKLVHMSHASNTVCPGTDVYMPPEAIDNKAVYTEKGDIFSFGVNVIQILTRKFPKPGDRHVTVPINDPRFPSGSIRVCVTEIERRQNHISLTEPTHSLTVTALSCLKDKEEQRPSASELCQRLTLLKDTSENLERTKGVCNVQLQTTIREKDFQIKELRQKILMHEQQYAEQLQQSQELLTVRQQEMDHMRKELRQMKGTLSKQNQTIEANLLEKKNNEEIIAQFQRTIEGLEQQLIRNNRPQPQAQQPSSTAKLTAGSQPYSSTATFTTADADTHPFRDDQSFEHLRHPGRGSGIIGLNWTWGKSARAPCVMNRDTDAVVSGSVAYFRPYRTRKIYAFNLKNRTWSRTLDCLPDHTTLAIVSGLLTTVGGDRSNQLFSLTGKGNTRKWTEEFPHMRIERSRATAICVESDLIVAGGLGVGIGGTKALTIVEIMNIDTRQWSTAADIPEPLYAASATICGDRLYMLGGMGVSFSESRLAISVSLPDLFQSLKKFTLFATKRNPVWSTISDLPIANSTCVSFYDQLVAIGGTNSDSMPTPAVSTYNPTDDSWQCIGQLSSPRSLCFAAVLPDNRIMAVGGFSSLSSLGKISTDTVEFATVVK